MSTVGSGVHELKHALAAHHLSRLRATATAPAAFRGHVNALATLLLFEATQNLELRSCRITTPMEETDAEELSGRIAAVPILRAGLGMVDPLVSLIPDIEVWHLGLYRDEATAQPVRYYDKLPRQNPVNTALVIDPMLATGGSACVAIETLKEWGVPQICLLSIISAPEGVQRIRNEYPDIPIFTCAVDRQLNDQKFILPGLGDAGDRIFNT